MVVSFDGRMTLLDKMRTLLLDYHDAEPHFTVNELAERLGEPKQTVRNILFQLQNKKEIELIKAGDAAVSRVIGARIIRLAPVGQFKYQSLDEARHRRLRGRRNKQSGPITITKAQPNPAAVAPAQEFPTLIEYMRKKQVIDAARESFEAVGIDASAITYTGDPLGEEAMALYAMVGQLVEENKILNAKVQRLSYDYQAEKRSVEDLRARLRKETNEELLAFTK